MNEVAAAGAFLQALSSAERATALYPDGHPIRLEKVDAVASAAAALSLGSGRFDLFVHDDSFFIGDRLLRRESLTMQGHLRDWQARGIDSISVSSSANDQDFAALIAHLAGAGPPPAGAVSINSAVLFSPEERPIPIAADLLRRAYVEALDLMRDFRSAISRGAKPPMGPARNAVDGLVEAVLADPGSSVLLTAMRTYDEPTFYHMVNVGILSIATGATIGLSRQQLTVLGLGGLLHDIGKIAVDPKILNEAGPLTDEQWTEIRRHPVEGAGMLIRSWDRISPLAAMIAFEHHHRLDGTGYPARPVRDSPQMMSRIVTVADIFDAVTSRRPYRRADHRERALDILLAGAGSSFDPRVVRLFVRMLGYYPPGAVVELDDGSTAVVVRNNDAALSRPVVKIVRDAGGAEIEPAELDLSSSRAVIVRGLDPDSAGVDAAELI